MNSQDLERSIIDLGQKKIFPTSQQESVLNSLYDNLINSKQDHNRVLGIIGERGASKTTLLKCLKNRLIQNTDHWFVTTEIIDASIVKEDLGIPARCIQALFFTLSTLTRRSSRPSPPEIADRELQESYSRCFQSALYQEGFHQTLAQELAMSPGHFAKIVQGAAEKRLMIPEEAANFTRQLKRALQELHKSTSQRTIAPEPSLVVFVDDLDLAPTDVVRNFVLSMLNLYSHADLRIVLSFDKDRLIRALSNDHHYSGAHSADNDWGLDLDSGRALLTKILPLHLQKELLPMERKDKLDFVPEWKTEHQKTLGEVLKESQIFNMQFLLPSYPRGLEEIYNWLLDPDTLQGDEPKHQNPYSFFYKLVQANGYSDLAKLMRQDHLRYWASTLVWEKNDVMSPAGWENLIDGIRSDKPLWSIPLPKVFEKQLRVREPWSLLEVILNIALREGLANPFQILTKMPFTKIRLQRSNFFMTFSAEAVESHFEQSSISKTAGLKWQKWHKVNDSGDIAYQVTLGPEQFWETFFHVRSGSPDAMFTDLYLTFPKMETGYVGDATKCSDILPTQFAALLLLTDKLAHAPWGELNSLRNFWSPTTFSICACSMTISSYIGAIWGNTPPLKLKTFYFSDTHAVERIRGLDDERIKTTFRSFIKELLKITMPNLTEFRHDILKNDIEGFHLLADTKVEIYRALKNLLKARGVRDLGA